MSTDTTPPNPEAIVALLRDVINDPAVVAVAQKVLLSEVDGLRRLGRPVWVGRILRAAVATFADGTDAASDDGTTEDGVATSTHGRTFSDKAQHATARALCFRQYGDWRYDPGNPDHRKWFVYAGHALEAAHGPALGLDRSVCLRDVVDALRDSMHWSEDDAYADFIAQKFGSA